MSEEKPEPTPSHAHATLSSRSIHLDPAYVEAMYLRWKTDPSSVESSWHYFFEGFELAHGAPFSISTERPLANLSPLIYAYRSQGHLIAKTDPLGSNPNNHPALDLANFGLSDDDLQTTFDTNTFQGLERTTLEHLIDALKTTYCGTIGVEYMHIQDRRIRKWLQSRMEPIRNRASFSVEEKRAILEALIDAETFEHFTHARFPGQKRFSLEGSETLIPALMFLIETAAERSVQEIVIGMAHRGRLNVLANIMGMSYESVFSEFEGNYLPNSVHGDGDVKYHKGYNSKRATRNGHTIELCLSPNPSHLEAVNPVVEGSTRAKQRQRNDTTHRKSVIPLLIHGDAAFAGQGIVAETLNLSQLEGYRTGGTLHFIINNQIGFTTLPSDARSSAYSTDVAKLIEAPIFHVNGDDPEATVFVTQLALEFRQEFGRDVVIDMLCYRRHGHNESDDPALTQPVLYKKIQNRPSVRTLYTQALVATNLLTETEAQQIEARIRNRLQTAFEFVKKEHPTIEIQGMNEYWAGLDGLFSHAPVRTGVSHATLIEIARSLSTVPNGFRLNPKLNRKLTAQFQAVKDKGTVDWGFAELLAFGSLLDEGTPVRLSGQDSARGTFSQRHAVWLDMERQLPYIPLNHIRDGQAKFCVYNSSLSEAAVLGFEYGYSTTEPHMLILWEAQFGDFANGAQVIIDQFIAGSESKWQRDSNITMLLPHGYEGQGPEHSSAYLERYLMACAEYNIQVCNLTTPAQYFHVLRRQMRREFRLPLIIMTPKSMLRHPLAVSSVENLIEGGFEELLDDPTPPSKGKVRRLLLCSGKLFWELVEERKNANVKDVAIVRIEQLYPFHQEKLETVIAPYLRRGIAEVVWVQEESQNRGAWHYVRAHLERAFPGHPIDYVGREASASPATGSLKVHQQEQQAILHEALHGVFRNTVEPKQQELKSHDLSRKGSRSRRVDQRRRLSRVV